LKRKSPAPVGLFHHAGHFLDKGKAKIEQGVT
jgi:hypothetical protein